MLTVSLFIIGHHWEQVLKATKHYLFVGCIAKMYFGKTIFINLKIE